MQPFVLADSAMGRFMKAGKVVLILGGRYAGRKAVIVKVKFNNSSNHQLGITIAKRH